jgi:hypothetical protein
MDPRVKQTIPFLRSAALQMRRIADAAPADVADSLRLMASELHVDADGLSRLHRRPRMGDGSEP